MDQTFELIKILKSLKNKTLEEIKIEDHLTIKQLTTTIRFKFNTVELVIEGVAIERIAGEFTNLGNQLEDYEVLIGTNGSKITLLFPEEEHILLNFKIITNVFVK